MNPEILANFSTEDELLIRNKNLNQTTNLKFVTFDNFAIDNQLKIEITNETFLNEFICVNELISTFRKNVSTFLVLNPNNILEIFLNCNVNYILLNINNFLLERQLTLISLVYRVKYKLFDCSENLIHYQQIIENEFKNKLLDELMILWTDDAVYQNEYIKANPQKRNKYSENDVSIYREEFRKGVENEKSILNILDDNLLPAICGVHVMIIYLKSIFEKCLKLIKKLSECYQEEEALDFLDSCCQIQVLNSKIKNTLKIPYDEIFNMNESSSEWENLKKHYERIVN